MIIRNYKTPSIHHNHDINKITTTNIYKIITQGQQQEVVVSSDNPGQVVRTANGWIGLWWPSEARKSPRVSLSRIYSTTLTRVFTSRGG